MPEQQKEHHIPALELGEQMDFDSMVQVKVVINHHQKKLSEGDHASSYQPGPLCLRLSKGIVGFKEDS